MDTPILKSTVKTKHSHCHCCGRSPSDNADPGFGADPKIERVTSFSVGSSPSGMGENYGHTTTISLCPDCLPMLADLVNLAVKDNEG